MDVMLVVLPHRNISDLSVLDEKLNFVEQIQSKISKLTNLLV